MNQSPIELAQTFADVARVLLAEDDIQAMLHRITELAVEMIEGCDHAGVSSRAEGSLPRRPVMTSQSR